MNFFDQIGKKASQTYQSAAKKTGKLSKIAKLKMKMNEDKDEIEQLYQEIGKKIYEKHIREEELDITSFLEERCSDIDLLCDEIEGIRQELLKLKDKKQCPNCNSEIEKGYKFCPNCGTKQEDIVVKKKEERKEIKLPVEENLEIEKDEG